jgi:hypothetical protein
MTASEVQVGKVKLSTTVPEIRYFIIRDRVVIILIFLRENGVEIPKNHPW